VEFGKDERYHNFDETASFKGSVIDFFMEANYLSGSLLSGTPNIVLHIR